MEKRIAIAATVLAALGGPILILGLTRGRLGVSYDSLAYLGLAESIRVGDGFVLPFTIPQRNHPVPLEAGELITHWAPGYPIIIAAVPAMQVAAVSAGVSPVLAASTTRVVLGRWTWHAPAAAWMVVLSPAIVLTQIHVLSEPPFIALSLACALAIAALQRTGQFRWVVAAAFAAAVTLLLRYIGIAIVAAVVAGVVLHPWNSWLERVRAMAFVGTAAAGAIALVLVMFGDSLLGNAAAVAGASEPMPLEETVAHLVVAMLELLVPTDWRLGIVLAPLILLGLAVAPRRDWLAFNWPFLATAIYLFVLVLANANASAIPFDLRLLSPVAAFMTIGIVLVLARRSGPLPPVILATVAITWVVTLSHLTPYTWEEAWQIAGCERGGPPQVCMMLDTDNRSGTQ